jgi:hypothetical protein
MTRQMWSARRRFKAPHCLVVSLPGRDLGVVVGTSGTAPHTHLGQRHDVQGEFELTVTAARQAMTDSCGAGHLDRGDPCVASERRRGGESAGLPSARQQPAADDRPDTVDPAQAAAASVSAI